MEFFRKVKAMCASEFMTYATCLERGSANMEFSHCRNTQVITLNRFIDHSLLSLLVATSVTSACKCVTSDELIMFDYICITSGRSR